MNPSFAESLDQFKRFLEANGYPSNVAWLTAEDVLLTGSRQIYVKLSSPTSNESCARELFERGVRSERGVLLHAFCEVSGTSCAFVWTPKDHAERLYAMMGTGLKLSVATREMNLQATAIKSSLLWFYLQMKYRRNQEMKDFLIRRSCV